MQVVCSSLEHLRRPRHLRKRLDLKFVLAYLIPLLLGLVAFILRAVIGQLLCETLPELLGTALLYPNLGVLERRKLRFLILLQLEF